MPAIQPNFSAVFVPMEPKSHNRALQNTYVKPFNSMGPEDPFYLLVGEGSLVMHANTLKYN